MRPINLLPPEAAERKRSRRLIGRLVALFAAFLVLLLLATLLFNGRGVLIRRNLETQLATNNQLEAEVVALGDVQSLQAAYDQNADLIRTALAGEVSWGRVLNDLGRMIPDRVWLESFTGSAEVQEVTLGQISVTGNAFDVPDVSAWIRSLDSDRFPSVAGAWVSSVSAATIGEYPVATFNSQASLTLEAESDRAEERIPEVAG